MDFECLRSIKKKNIKSIILKLDLQKAYDCIDYDTLQLIVIHISFYVHFTNWIMSCVSSSSFTILVNGEVTDCFRRDHGLRHICPLFLLLFILVIEGLSLILKEKKVVGKLTSIKLSGQVYKHYTHFICR